MNSTERNHPCEWLRLLEETPGAHRALLEECGGLAPAAYRVARARCRVQAIPSHLPTVRELQAAAIALCRRLDDDRGRPNAMALARECQALGLQVIVPLRSGDKAA